MSLPGWAGNHAARLARSVQAFSTPSPQSRQPQNAVSLDRPRDAGSSSTPSMCPSFLVPGAEFLNELEFKNTIHLPGTWNVLLMLDAQGSCSQ